jgi:glycosyltransferase involved in cell wall biosynthesis
MTKWVVCSGNDWYRPSYSSTRQIMDEFYNDGYNILWVNPIPFKSGLVNSVNKKSLIKKIRNKLLTHLNIFKVYSRGFFVFVPFYIPVFKPWAEKLNERLINMQMSFVKSLLGIKDSNAILWISGSFTLFNELEKKYHKKVCEAADLISAFRTNNIPLKEKLRVKEAELCDKSDVLFACSDIIAEKMEKLTTKKIDLLYHGVDFCHFNKLQEPAERMLEIKKKGLPIAGYFGSLSDANDLRVFEILAKNNFSVVIIGKVLGDYSSLMNLQNVYFLGPVEYNKLPSYGQSFDIGLMNWHMAEWIENSYPIKTLEYLAMGKPVVTVPIHIVKKLFGDLVYYASNPEEFLYKAKQAVAENSEEKRIARISKVGEYDWSKRYDLIKTKVSLN